MSDYMHVGIDFIDAKGERVTSIQRVRDGKSIANAGFINGELNRILHIDSVDRAEFVAAARDLMDRSFPVNFQETILPA